MKSLFILTNLLFLSSTPLFAEKVIWSQNVHADGNPSKAVELTLDKKYKIRASGTCNLGKWVQAGHALEEDACYEFNGPEGPQKITVLQNSQNISVCQDKYLENHQYESKEFVAKINKIHFWIVDTDYSNNSGTLKVEVIEIE